MGTCWEGLHSKHLVVACVTAPWYVDCTLPGCGSAQRLISWGDSCCMEPSDQADNSPWQVFNKDVS